ncbi:MAG: hypothetical protein CMH57_13570 [Myxococcales bacterium]|nr:hypothetical protein [Myxococcales bacterium]
MVWVTQSIAAEKVIPTWSETMSAALDLRHFWETQTHPRARHHCDGLEHWVQFMDENFLTHFEREGIETVMEWGCGRGEMSLKIAQRGLDLHLVDLIDASLDLAELKLICHGLAPASRTQVDDPEAIQLPVERVDALLCVAVVQHFPTIAYWRQIAAKWRSLEPEVIVLQTRHADDANRQPQDYTKEYIYSLWLTTDEVLSQFPGYRVTAHHVDRSDAYIWSPNANFEFFVLERS